MIINLTQHAATPEQLAVGVFDLPPDVRGRLVKWLTFDTIPCRDELLYAAEGIGLIAFHGGYKRAMIGGAPYLMAPLEQDLKRWGVEVLYAYSRRESVEETLPDGSVRKVMIFRHAGFINAL